MNSNREYIRLVEKILEEGIEGNDRTSIGTISIFGEMLTFNLDKFPLLSIKRIKWEHVVHELLWFISGSTNHLKLDELGVKIWNKNGSREFMESINLHYKVGDLGPIYGFQWRHFGENYIDCFTKYEGGVDQLQNIIGIIRKDPSSRCLLMSSWNAMDLPKMALPPCHYSTQFYVRGDKLDCLMSQRSADVGLGLPFNIASYALLTNIIAKITNLTPGLLKISLGNAHIYKNHITQLKNLCQKFHESEENGIQLTDPDLIILNNRKEIDEFKFEDFTIKNYNPLNYVKLELN